jgi:hypothetical protein
VLSSGGDVHILSSGKASSAGHTSPTSSTESRCKDVRSRLRMRSMAVSIHVHSVLIFMPSSMCTCRCLLSTSA